MKARQQRRRLIRESALQIPHLTQTANEQLATVRDKGVCDELTGQWGEEDGEKRKEEVGGTHDKIENVEALLEFEV